MSKPWFRFYTEFYRDPKVQSMSEAMQRRLVMLFCLYGCNVSETLHETDIAFSMRIEMDQLIQTRDLFLKKGFIEIIDEKWVVKNWNKRQFISDSSTYRVKQYREKKRSEHETFQKRSRNVIDTDTETDPEIYIDHFVDLFVDRFENFWNLYPRKVAKKKCRQKFVLLCKKEKVIPEDILHGLKNYLPHWENKSLEYIPHPYTWLNQGRWSDDLSNIEVHPF